jgi:tRNA modification GTPase
MITGSSDTIAAIATASGVGAIGVVRVSGPDAIAITEIGFRGRAPLSVAPGYTLHHGTIHSPAGEEVDEVLVSLFRAPHSYTGEDSVEVSCHGGMVQTQRVLSTILHLGARPALPGEFTRRAFLNGRIDLSQAEAVASLISSKSRASARASLGILEGRFSSSISSLREELVGIAGLLELEMDFSEEGIDLVTNAEIQRRVAGVLDVVDRLGRSYRSGRMIREGVSMVLAGRPNSGKSSLFNALLMADRAIVTSAPGTTRDTLEEEIEIEGVLFRLTDTAGIRESRDAAEAEGIRRGASARESADLLLLVHDLTEEDHSLPVGAEPGAQAVIHVWNKVDLLRPAAIGEGEILVSAKTGEGLDDLRRSLRMLVDSSEKSIQDGEVVIVARHADCLARAGQSLLRALDLLAIHGGRELVATEVREGIRYLEEIVGIVTTDDVLDRIFAGFCIGK